MFKGRFILLPFPPKGNTRCSPFSSPFMMEYFFLLMLKRMIRAFHQGAPHQGKISGHSPPWEAAFFWRYSGSEGGIPHGISFSEG